MATLSNITTGLQSVSGTGPVTGTLDTSTLTGDYTVKLRITRLAAGKRAVIALEDVLGTTLQLRIWEFVGSIAGAADITVSVKKNEIPAARFGSGVFRLDVLSLDASASLQLQAWIEQ